MSSRKFPAWLSEPRRALRRVWWTLSPWRLWRRARGEWQRSRTERRGHRVGATLPAPVTRPEPPREITQLERFFDANLTGPRIFKWRHYFEIYDRHLAKFRGREVHVVEIGVRHGGSLSMWHDYFGPHAHVYGVDIDPSCTSLQTENTHIFIGDQADPEFWSKFIQQVPRIDVVIDDGGHEAHQQIATIEALLPHLSPGGVYLCEDIHGAANAFHDYLAGLARNLHRFEDVRPVSEVPAKPFQQLVSSLHIYTFLAVLEARTERVESFRAEKRGVERAASAPQAPQAGAR